ncbi:energy transducer TonB [Pseudobacteriovorax antillogorgiicola]|uniref:Outer membrane transport energization protein TonB n=1 Tax=Pseudobacteriovorax antillogorgiicola TaxID=1513793 RepID=A0A1Y6BNQ4_9BACT|nr:energy transducer TonB [Pseudobacteriovorax antillogorgiicola]TCS53919.1 outer membrane transport energization protein TonB [Pseudobacteriovorax antillogorgiicola]SMF20581.1 outer membrane transport energization protein TonB [Pseudobacteriovorax antillogorgiicola]
MRYLVALGAGGLVTLGLFYFMSVLISQGKKKPVENDLGPVVEFIRVKRDQETKTRSRELPKKPPPPKAAPSKPKMQVAENDQPQAEQLDMPQPKIANGLKGGMGPYLGGGGGGGNSDGEVMPIVRIAPQMPRKARMRGIEGYVVASFTVTKSGSVSDVKIVEAKPPRIFNREAKRAILKWKYKPQIVDGKAVEIPQTIRLDFKLEGEE